MSDQYREQFEHHIRRGLSELFKKVDQQYKEAIENFIFAGSDEELVDEYIEKVQSGDTQFRNPRYEWEDIPEVLCRYGLNTVSGSSSWEFYTRTIAFSQKINPYKTLMALPVEAAQWSGFPLPMIAHKAAAENKKTLLWELLQSDSKGVLKGVATKYEYETFMPETLEILSSRIAEDKDSAFATIIECCKISKKVIDLALSRYSGYEPGYSFFGQMLNEKVQKNRLLAIRFLGTYTTDDSLALLESHRTVEKSKTVVAKLDETIQSLKEALVVNKADAARRSSSPLPALPGTIEEIQNRFQGYCIPFQLLHQTLTERGWEPDEILTSGHIYEYGKFSKTGMMAVDLKITGGNIIYGNESYVAVDYLLFHYPEPGETYFNVALSPEEIDPCFYEDLCKELEEILTQGTGFNPNWEQLRP